MSEGTTGLLVAVAGTDLTDAEISMLKHPAVVGLTLFGRNIQSIAQLSRLIAAIRAVRPQLIIAVDQEGGRVQRIQGGGVTRLPALHLLGQGYSERPDAVKRSVQDHAMVMASELKALDIDLSFAPVVDTFNPDSQVIGDRSFHHDPEVIATLAGEYIKAMNAAGMIATLKHFPGHGGVAGDTHIERPVDQRALDAIHAADMLPYQRLLDDERTAVMCSHVVYQQVDAAPASFSRRWIHDILRQQMGFSGVVMSDDLGMAAASVADSLLQRAKMAATAGCDLLLVCESEAAQQLVAQWPAHRVAEALQGRLRGSSRRIGDNELNAARQRLAGLL